MAVVSEPCPRCGAPVDVGIGQSPFHDPPWWSWSVRCTCGYTIEADDVGLPPERYRAALLEQHGVWGLRVDDPGKAIPAALGLKDALAIDRAAALRMVKAIPGVVWTGTEVEVAWLKRKLAERGVPASCESVFAEP